MKDSEHLVISCAGHFTWHALNFIGFMTYRSWRREEEEEEEEEVEVEEKGEVVVEEEEEEVSWQDIRKQLCECKFL